jgi:hypothetical protein
VSKGARSELFLSCDLVGSTSFKQRGPGWQDAFLGFYRQFPQRVGDVAKDLGVDLTFDLWKAVGDELIFTVTVTHEDDVYDAVRVWVQAMDRYEADPLHPKTGMRVKGGAFIATFPGPDSESSVPRDPSSETSDLAPVLLNDAALKGRRNNTKYLYDFFGPSIDTGFRVVSACSQRHFTLAVEVAWALLLANRDKKTRHLDDFTFLGSRSMKGVWNGRDYPLFALDRHHTDDVNKSIRDLTDGGVDLTKAETLCRECVTSVGWVSAIYLPKSGVEGVTAEPADSLASLRQDNTLKGSETLPPGDPEKGKELKSEPPLGKETPSDEPPGS